MSRFYLSNTTLWGRHPHFRACFTYNTRWSKEGTHEYGCCEVGGTEYVIRSEKHQLQSCRWEEIFSAHFGVYACRQGAVDYVAYSHRSRYITSATLHHLHDGSALQSKAWCHSPVKHVGERTALHRKAVQVVHFPFDDWRDLGCAAGLEGLCFPRRRRRESLHYGGEGVAESVHIVKHHHYQKKDSSLVRVQREEKRRGTRTKKKERKEEVSK